VGYWLKIIHFSTSAKFCTYTWGDSFSCIISRPLASENQRP